MAKKPCRLCGQDLVVSAKSLPEPTCQPCRRTQAGRESRPIACKQPKILKACSRCDKPLRRAKLDAPICTACRNAPVTPTRPRRKRTLKPMPRGCDYCGVTFRPYTSRQVRCAPCAKRLKDCRLKICAWCGEQRWFDRKAECCSRECANQRRRPPRSTVRWTQCASCMRWHSTPQRRRFGACSDVCEREAIAVLVWQPKVGPRCIECPRCGTEFTTSQPAQRFCSARCTKKDGKLRRKVCECETYGEWTWSDFMRVARKFDYCCAYCGTRPNRLDPDHVVPLAGRGSNTISNLLPACQACNSDKSALSLDQWLESRVRRGLPPVTTTWDPADRRYWHLTEVRRWTHAA